MAKEIKQDFEDYIGKETATLILSEYHKYVEVKDRYLDNKVPLRSILTKSRKSRVSRANIDRVLKWMVEDGIFNKDKKKYKGKTLYKLNSKYKELVYRAVDKGFIDQAKNIEYLDGISIYGFPRRFLKKKHRKEFDNILKELECVQKKLEDLKFKTIWDPIIKNKKRGSSIIIQVLKHLMLEYCARGLDTSKWLSIHKAIIDNFDISKEEKEKMIKVLKHIVDDKEKSSKQFKIEKTISSILEPAGIFIHIWMGDATKIIEEKTGKDWFEELIFRFEDFK